MSEPGPPIGVPFKKGDFVRVTCDGRTVEGMVTMASPNGRSLVLMFEALLAGHAGKMPVLQHDDGSFCALLNGAPVGIEKVGKARH
jgi:hypothetical protein